MSEQVVAQVVLRPRAGPSVVETKERVTAETVGAYKVEEAVIREAREKLQALGFNVTAAGPHGLSITGDRSLFERVFGTRLAARQAAAPGAPGAAFEAKEPIKIPDELAALVADVILPSPPELYP